MGARGQPPTPTAILKLRGSWRAKLNEGEPIAPAGRPTVPKYFDAAHRRLWNVAVRLLEDMRLGSKADAVQLERYVVQLVRWRACEAFIAENGLSCEGSEYPEVKESHKLSQELRRFEDRFGMSPSARTRIKSGDLTQAKPNEKAEFFGDSGAEETA